MARHFLIDTDTASDDAVALVMAMRHPGVQIEAITVVAGNVPLDQAIQNALYTVELCQQAIPVYRGMPGPLTRPLETAQFVHGQDGMGDIGLPLTGRQPAAEHAVGVIIETIHRYAGEIILVTLGPLTNIATALRRDPMIANEVKECIIMGGIKEFLLLHTLEKPEGPTMFGILCSISHLHASAMAYPVSNIPRWLNICRSTKSISKCARPATYKPTPLAPMPITPSTNCIGRDFLLV